MAGEPTAFTPATFADTLPHSHVTFAPSNIRTDPLRYLPGAAADRLRMLQQRVEDARNLCPDFEERQAASRAKIEAENRVKRLIARAAEGGFDLGDDHVSVVAARRELADRAADHKRIDDLYAVRSANLQAASGALAACEAWLRSGRTGNTALEAVETDVPKLNKGETITDAIERHRRRVRELRADAHRIESSCYPSSYCKKRMREQVEQLAARGTPSVARLVELDGPVDFQTVRMQAQVLGGAERSLAFSEVPDAVALFCWLNKDQLIKRLDAEIDSEADDAAALTHEVRQTRSAEVMGDLLSVERDECALTWRAQSEGLPCEHRSNINPLALLGLRLITAPRANSSPGTSPGMAFDVVGPRR